MSAVDHYAEAVRLARQAEAWRDFDRWPMETIERLTLGTIDAQLASVHASLHSASVHASLHSADDPTEATA